MKIRPVGAELFHADGLTDRDRQDESDSRFSHSCERAQKKRNMLEVGSVHVWRSNANSEFVSNCLIICLLNSLDYVLLFVVSDRVSRSCLQLD
jgi:hypothetical protein